MPVNAEDTILLRNTMRVFEGRLDAFKAAVAEAVQFVERHGPQIMVQTFLDEDRLVAVSYQLYADSASILRHWELADPHINRVMEHCVVLDLEVYGAPDAAVLAGLREMMDDGRARVIPRLAGFVRVTGGHPNAL